MEKNILIILLLIIQTISSQEETKNLPKRDTQKNDLSINVHYYAFIDGININYDRVIKNNLTIGISLFKAYNNQDALDNSDIALTTATNFFAIPNIKYYLGKRFARRFYVQAFSMISSGKVFNFNSNTSLSQETNFTEVALGVGIGDKRILKNGIFIDFGVGFAYNLLSKNTPESFLHPNLSIGYRF